MTWPSLERGTQRCLTLSRWCCPCCVTTCPTGGRGGLRTSQPAGAASAAPPSPQKTSASFSATSSRSSTTTWASTRPPGWRGLQVGAGCFSFLRIYFSKWWWWVVPSHRNSAGTTGPAEWPIQCQPLLIIQHCTHNCNVFVLPWRLSLLMLTTLFSFIYSKMWSCFH